MLLRTLWHKIAVFFVVLGILSFAVKHLYKEDSTWQNTSVLNLELKINTMLQHVYWQWQNEGRPHSVFFKPENSLKGFDIKVSIAGRPNIEQSLDGCTLFLNWVLDDTPSHISVDATTLSAHVLDETADEFICLFNTFGHQISYNAATGELTKQKNG